MTAILGRKIGMTQSYREDGKLLPVTLIEAGPCRVLQQKTVDRDGYQAAVLGFEKVEGSKVKNRGRLGFFKKLGLPVFKIVREFRGIDLEVGKEINVSEFQPGDRITIVGVSRGKGWASGIKRWNFSRGRETHGGNFNRAIGSCGMKEFPGRTIKGKKMSGRMGGNRKTLKNVEVVGTIPEDNILLVKGPVTGGENGLLLIERTSKAA